MPQDDLKGSGSSEEVRQLWRDRARRSTYFMAKAVCGFKDLDPDLHGMMASWIQRPTLRKLGLAPRSHLKTSVWTIAESLRRVADDSNVRILLTNETFPNASAMLQQIAAVVEQRELFRWLFPEIIPDTSRRETRWNTEALQFRRTAILKEATIEAIGVGGASTSRHYDLILEDDLIGKKARDSPLVMQDAVDQHKLAESLLDNPRSTIHTYGTLWAPNDLYAWILRHQPAVDFLRLSVWRPDGTPLWPARFSSDVIDELRQTQGAALFALQYENRVIASGLTEFQADWLRYWSWSDNGDILVERPASEGGAYKVKVGDLSVFHTIDAGVGGQEAVSRTANVVCGLTPPQRLKPFDIIMLEAQARRTTPADTLNNAWALCQRWHPQIAAIEVVGAHMVFWYWALQEFPRMPLRRLKTANSNKLARIREVCAPYGEQGRIYIHRNHQDFVEEWEAFPSPGCTRDLLDAFAYQSQIWCPPDGPDFDAGLQDEDDRDIAEADAIRDGRSPVTGY